MTAATPAPTPGKRIVPKGSLGTGLSLTEMEELHLRGLRGWVDYVMIKFCEVIDAPTGTNSGTPLEPAAQRPRRE